MDRSRRLTVSLALNAGLVVALVVFGIRAHSSGLLADAGHNAATRRRWRCAGRRPPGPAAAQRGPLLRQPPRHHPGRPGQRRPDRRGHRPDRGGQQSTAWPIRPVRAGIVVAVASLAWWSTASPPWCSGTVERSQHARGAAPHGGGRPASLAVWSPPRSSSSSRRPPGSTRCRPGRGRDHRLPGRRRAPVDRRGVLLESTPVRRRPRRT